MYCAEGNTMDGLLCVTILSCENHDFPTYVNRHETVLLMLQCVLLLTNQQTAIQSKRLFVTYDTSCIHHSPTGQHHTVVDE